MKRKTILLISGLVVLAILVQFGAAQAQTRATVQDQTGPTVTELPDGSLLILGTIQYNNALNGYVVQAQVPQGGFGRYLIVNPENIPLSAVAKKGTPVTVQGMLTEGSSFLLMLQTINGKAYNRQ